ncbi:MAG: hypothetical protein KDA93_14200 [Planctomycetaceae bacterium]|nr:hypothetical protein [Planctomycetaceae bacterium]
MDAERSRLLTPSRLLAALMLFTLLFGLAFLTVFLSSPSTITLDISAPVGETVVCHVVVDGRAEVHEGVVPVTYHFKAHELTYAVVGVDPTTDDLTVSATDQSGSGGSVNAAGVKGTYKTQWWGSKWSHGRMTESHVTNMRRSAAHEQEGPEGNEADEAQNASP